MKHLLAVLVIAAAMTTSCNNSGVEAAATPAKTADSAAKTVDSATKAAPDTLKAAAPADSTKK
ncbi:hypothetical protein [Puia sp.]|uniref:hypothetical protein n=1 Tax=Puia sp. TaxID=2045100 RepID=UPI002F3E7D06